MSNFTTRYLLALCAVARAVKSDNLRNGRTRLLARDLGSCTGNEGEWKFALTLDDYPWETSWAIKDSVGDLITSGPPAGMNYVRRGEYEDAGCLPPGDYTLTVKDKSGDGLCCQYGSGKFELTIDDVIVVESDDTKFKTLDFGFTVNAKTEAPSTPRPTNKPTTRPSKKPTKNPSKNPTKAPIQLTKPVIPPITPWPTYEPSNSPIMIPTKSPTTKPSYAPTSSPTAKPTNLPTAKPTNSPTKTPTKHPSKDPTIPPFTSNPTGSPSKTESEFPSKAQSEIPSTTQSQIPSVSDSEIPSHIHSEVPSQSDGSSSLETTEFLTQYASATSNDTVSEYTFPSAYPTTSSTNAPSNTSSESPTKMLSEFPSKFPSDDPTAVSSATPSSIPSSSPSRKRLVVPITPFSLILSTNETEIDIDELDAILTDHLFQQMQTNLPKSTEVSSVDLLLTDITLGQHNLKMDEEAQGSQAKQSPGKQNGSKNETNGVSSSAPTSAPDVPAKTTTHEISVNGDAYFAGNALPTTEQLDDLTKAAFEGEAGNEFVQDLLSADDSGLQSTVSISVPIDTSDKQLTKDFLYSAQTETPSSESSNNALYIVGALFVVGCLLVAAFVHRTRQAQRSREHDIDDFIEEIDEEEEDVDLPKYIDIKPVERVEGGNDCEAIPQAAVNDCTEGCSFYSFFDGINEAPSQASTEVASNQTSSPDRTRQTINDEDNQTIGVANAEDSSNGRSARSTLYKIEENEEDNTDNVGMFCGLNQGHSTNTKLDDKSRFGLENDWGMKPSASEDTNAVQMRRY
ncbi:hypothetical protein HJC23_005516 [Cyclotella cryptica]|uniref:Uncharacterized protein n=1 Tax=Cyclotella cryptica TaxID=29204 RepID=A0ABD3NNH8_9STRA|eukprot:CCRYP_020280-RA/>CCRYP_020280-RA protein AED:0.03 eAED:0.03 QI:276/1/1/1/1/1/5/148/793